MSVVPDTKRTYTEVTLTMPVPTANLLKEPEPTRILVKDELLWVTFVKDETGLTLYSDDHRDIVFYPWHRIESIRTYGLDDEHGLQSTFGKEHTHGSS